MRLGILKADSVLPQFQPAHGDYPDRFFRRLQDNSNEQLQFVTYDVEHGEYPPDLNDCEGYIITGSKKSVYDDEAWIRELESFVVKLHEQQKPLVGICFGHQLVAQALGGKTEPAAVGWGVGVHSAEVVSQQEYMQPAIVSPKFLVSHKDQVTQLPKNAELLASSEFCPFSMFQIEQHIFCMQGHPEFRPEYSRDLIHMRKELIGDAVFQQGIASLDEGLDSDVIAGWILNFLRRAANLDS